MGVTRMGDRFRPPGESRTAKAAAAVQRAQARAEEARDRLCRAARNFSVVGNVGLLMEAAKSCTNAWHELGRAQKAARGAEEAARVAERIDHG